MGKSTYKPKKIPLLFSLGIGIPCILLGYLAFRGVKNDQALLEKERLNEQHEILEKVTESIEENIISAEQAFSYILKVNEKIDQPEIVSALDSLSNLYPLVEEVFFYDNSWVIHLPLSQPLFLPNGSIQAFPASPPFSLSNEKLLSGQQFEFQDKNYQKALTSYRQAFEKDSDHQMRGGLLNAIGRVQKKLSLYGDAERTYGIIARDYNHVPTEGGVPLGLAARSEFGSLQIVMDDTIPAIKTFLDLYKDLLNREWILEKAQYDFFSQHIRQSVDEIFLNEGVNDSLDPYQNSYKLLIAEEKKQKNNTERLLTFREDVAADIRAKIPRDPEAFRTSSHRFTLESGNHTYLVSLLSGYAANESIENNITGLLFNSYFLKDSLLQKTLQTNISSVNTGWMVKGRDDRTILQSENLPSGRVTARTNFTGGFPPWFIELYHQETYLFETFLTSRRGIYFYIFILLTGILIFGLILTIRTVSRELELSKMKSDFVSTISHEFKSPLSSIRQLSEMLQSGRVPSEEYRNQYYDVLVEQSERLSLLIDNILDFSKIEEGRKEFNFELIDVGILLQEIVNVIQDQVRHKEFDIKLIIEKPLQSIKADREAISQAVTNLVDNAIKYSGEARDIIVRAYEKNQYLLITVKDFGTGIRKEEIDKVFERFYRGGDEFTRTVKGSGLGLTLVKQIMEAHGGRIDVESEVGKGSIFTVSIPLGLN